MKIQFQENEFTRTDILQYLTKAYGRQLNGNRFSIHNLNNWARVGKIPNLYGGHRILQVDTYPIGKGIKIYTLEGLTRDIVKDVDLLPNKTPLTKRVDKRTLPRKHRTQYYYDILAKHGKQYTRRTLSDSILPDNWKEIGIKQNQLRQRKKMALI
jgi:hypothetical protein